ncbi:MAG: DUF4279 domain-containing protein [Calditrichaeota bacterium]|nr:DUF4279 domain-containing protein [Calditrichota bacterium]
MNKIKIILSFFSGDFTKEDISKILGINSDNISNSSITWTKCWEFKPSEKYIEDEISIVVNKLFNKKSQIHKITNDSELAISGFLYSPGSIGIHINKSTLKKICELNIPLDFDIYDLSE